MCGGRSSHQKRRDRGGDAERDAPETPRRRPLEAERVVHRYRSRTCERERCAGGGEHDRVLPPAVRHPGAAPSEREGRVEHDAHDRGACQGGQEANREQRAATGLTEASDDREQLTGSVPEQLEEHAGSPTAVPAEPAEQLLGPVADYQEAEDQARDQQAATQCCAVSQG